MMQRFRLAGVLALALFAWGGAHAEEPTALETYFVELINRARANPGAEASRLGIELNEGVPASKTISDTPKPPLALDATLTGVARAHSQDMYQNDYFSHYNLAGQSPFDRGAAAGYPDLSGENIAYTANFSSDPNGVTKTSQTSADEHHANLFIDKDYPERGHRTNMLNESHVTVGAGFADGEDSSQPGFYGWNVYSTTNFGRPSGVVHICGVAYDDTNGSGFYDVGEGVGGITYTIVETGQSVAGFSTGGYAIPLTSSGTYTVRASVSGLTASKSVTVGSVNVKLDFTRADFGAASGGDTGGGDGDDGSGDDGSGGSGSTDDGGATAPSATVYARVRLFDAGGSTPLEGDTATAGDVFSCQIALEGSAAGADLYAALVTPWGEIYFVPSEQTLSLQPTPLPAAGLSGTSYTAVLTAYVPRGLPAGTYAFYTVVVPAGADIYDGSAWADWDAATFTLR